MGSRVHPPGRFVAALPIVTALALGACGGGTSGSSTTTAGSASASTSGTGNGSGTFSLGEGFEHDVCGIGVSVKFIPANSSASTSDVAVLFGGPTSNVQDTVSGHTADQPLASNAAFATAGSIITVYGKQFKVVAVNVDHSQLQLNSTVQVQPLC